MVGDTKNSFRQYLSKVWGCFDESTFISPNKNGEKEKGAMEKVEQGIKKENLAEFADSNSISLNDLLLAGLTLTLNKFNFSHDTLIFNENNVPFFAKLEKQKHFH